MTFPLPWTFDSAWLLFQTALQLSFVVIVMAIVIGLLALFVATFIADLG